MLHLPSLLFILRMNLSKHSFKVANVVICASLMICKVLSLKKVWRFYAWNIWRCALVNDRVVLLPVPRRYRSTRYVSIDKFNKPKIKCKWPVNPGSCTNASICIYMHSYRMHLLSCASAFPELLFFQHFFSMWSVIVNAV